MEYLKLYENFTKIEILKLKAEVRNIHRQYYEYDSKVYDLGEDGFRSYLILGQSTYKVNTFCDKHSFDVLVYDGKDHQVEEHIDTNIEKFKELIIDYEAIDAVEDLGLY